MSSPGANLAEDKGPLTIRSIYPCAAVATIALVARFTSRKLMRVQWSQDDYAVLICLVHLPRLLSSSPRPQCSLTRQKLLTWGTVISIHFCEPPTTPLHHLNLFGKKGLIEGRQRRHLRRRPAHRHPLHHLPNLLPKIHLHPQRNLHRDHARHKSRCPPHVPPYLHHPQLPTNLPYPPRPRNSLVALRSYRRRLPLYPH